MGEQGTMENQEESCTSKSASPRSMFPRAPLTRRWNSEFFKKRRGAYDLEAARNAEAGITRVSVPRELLMRAIKQAALSGLSCSAGSL